LNLAIGLGDLYLGENEGHRRKRGGKLWKNGTRGGGRETPLDSSTKEATELLRAKRGKSVRKGGQINWKKKMKGKNQRRLRGAF